VKAESTGGIVGVNNNRIVPRLAIVRDVHGDGRHLIHATYGVHSGWNIAVKPDPKSPKDSRGLAKGCLPGPLFGQATSASQFPVPFGGLTGGRTFRLAVGFRF
jgi:hypothetical protein